MLKQLCVQILIRSVKKFHGRGQLLPRERLALLLDPNSRVLELCGLAGFKMHDDDGAKSASGGGAIACIGQVEGVRCAIYVHDSAIKGGAVSPMGVQKALRLQEVALENRLPMITLAESAGGNLNYQSELFVPGGRTFANQAKISAAGIPQITVVHGSSTAGGAYVPGLSDYVIMVRKKAKVFLAGPPLVKAAIGEDSDDETLGGADMHAKYTGLAEYLADDDRQAIAQARQVLAGLHWPKHQINPTSEEPHYSPDELCGVVPLDYRKPYDAREVIVRLADRSEFVEFKPSYGSEILTAHATIGGYPVGIIANNGPIFPDSSVKGGSIHSALWSIQHTATLPTKYNRLHGRGRSRAKRYRQAWSQIHSSGRECDGSQIDTFDWGRVWCRPLRDVWSVLRPSLHIRLAQ